MREENLSFNNNSNNKENKLIARKVKYDGCSTRDEEIKIYIFNTFTVN